MEAADPSVYYDMEKTDYGEQLYYHIYRKKVTFLSVFRPAAKALLAVTAPPPLVKECLLSSFLFL